MMSSHVIIHSARLITSGQITSNAWVKFTGDRVTAVGSGASWHKSESAATVVDARGATLTPGFIDLHCHGGGGSSVEDGPRGIAQTLAVHRAHGTTRSVLSLVSAPIDVLARRLSMLARVTTGDDLVLGSHLEGPFLNPSYRGAHDITSLREIDAASLARLQQASDGTLRVVTLAPDLPGAMRAIKELVAGGVTAAIGHTAADYQTAMDAFDSGASLLTHAFNGMPGIHHRAPGPVTAALQSPDTTLEIINDGVHVHPAVVSLTFDQAPGRIALVTDAMAAAGASDGDYLLGETDVVVRAGVARLRNGDSIAGSTLTLDQALRRTVGVCGVPLTDAVGALTSTPARALGRQADLGQLRPGYLADAVLLDRDLHVIEVWAAGRRLHPVGVSQGDLAHSSLTK